MPNNHKKMRFMTIRSKLASIITMIIAAISIFIFVYFPANLKKHAISALSDKANSIISITAYSIAPGLVFDDKDAIREVINSAITNKDLVFIVVKNDSGRIVDSYARAVDVLHDLKKLHTDSTFAESHEIYHVTSPVIFNNSKVGEICLGFSLAQVSQEINSSRNTAAFVSLLILIIGMIAVYAISAVITKPLMSIAKSAKHIAQGDLTIRTNVTTNDEVGDLANAFNIMVDNIQTSQNKLIDLNAGLEEKVRERTKELRDEISDRIKAEEELAQSLSLLTATLESTADGILVVNNEGKIINLNQKFIDMWSIPPEIIQSKDNQKAIDFVLGQLKYPELFLKKVQESYAHLDIESEDTLELIDGKIFERYSQPYKLGGKSVGRVWSFRDITEKRRLEDSLRQSQKMEAIGRLAGGVAHDFNNVLTVIMGYGDFLASKIPRDDPMFKDLEEIKKAAERASSLTHQLLAFSRKQIMSPKVLDLNKVVGNMEKMLKRLIGEDIDMVFIPKENLYRIWADQGQIEQVIMNIVVNARDAMPDGGKITIETANVELDEAYAHAHGNVQRGPHVVLSISDTGIGMDENTKSRIFEPFFTTKEVGKGTGLGLATVYGIVKQTGGDIYVYSEPGKGTTFKIYLPQINQEQENRAGAENTNESLDGDETILLVEDEKSLRDLAFAILVRRGYTVLEAGNGEEATAISRNYNGTIHLMLTDVIMPLMNGRELADKLRQERPDMHVLFMSGYTDEAIIRHGVLDSMDAFIQKPFTPVRLAKTVREILDGRTQKTAKAN
jgi:signal transduction histidine kinase/HAMP domain-containing protein/ActR/RegA family two-component response regulator